MIDNAVDIAARGHIHDPSTWSREARDNIENLNVHEMINAFIYMQCV